MSRYPCLGRRLNKIQNNKQASIPMNNTGTRMDSRDVAKKRPPSGPRLIASVIFFGLLTLPLSFFNPVRGPFVPGPKGYSTFDAVAAETNYQVGPEDEISITVWDNPDLSRRMRINLEGKVSFPLIGEVQVAGLSPLEIEKRIRDMLADGYLVNPQVSVQVAEYRSQKIFIIGEVNSPGAYPLTRKTLLVEVIAMAGGVKQEADHEIMIVRPKKSKSIDRALLPDEADPSELVKIRLRDVLEGEKSQNIEVRNLDTIFVPRIKVFYVTGEVKRPGQYTFMKGMTVLHAISTAGGYTDKAARRKATIVREKEGRKVESSIATENSIEPGDTIVVPESFW
jgi:polysaccharide biosynthesis/export protein